MKLHKRGKRRRQLRALERLNKKYGDSKNITHHAEMEIKALKKALGV